MRYGLPSTAVAGDRFGVSDRDVAAIVSSVLHDVGLITSNNSDLVVDGNKLRREKAKALLTCETLPVTTFEIIDGELPTTGRRDLSKDQMYLLEISQALRLGNCSDELARRNPGTLSHSRWLTTANGVLRLYLSSPASCLKLKQIAEFVMKVYTLNWFNIKSKHSLKY
ncbi:hypothetical protein AVEN_121049-1 [Araneus ventricosus]|uniref:Uncharacterized protein n=1 Tax=Araneus ventricosus TaxID=182803 RepID=A0A4Y2F640_ARAVE|nr:hypothetical protein AVEN_121049-1 [Araneus ventricosus]